MLLPLFLQQVLHPLFSKQEGSDPVSINEFGTFMQCCIIFIIVKNPQNETFVASEVTQIAPKAAVESHSHRVRRRPAWMSDYEVTEIDQSEDPFTHFALFSYCDPTLFESAIKESKWQRAMDSEIAAIKKNDTWELYDLPKGHKTIGVSVFTRQSWRRMVKLTSTRHAWWQKAISISSMLIIKKFLLQLQGMTQSDW